MPPLRYILSERAANALRALISPGSTYSSRPRPSRPVPSSVSSELFDLRCRPASGGEAAKAFIYIGADSNQQAACNAVRINGRAVVFDSVPGEDGWFGVPGDADTYRAIWLRFSVQSGPYPALDVAENWFGGRRVRAEITPTTSVVESPSWPDGRAFHAVLLWARIGDRWTRCHTGGVDITVDLADADGDDPDGERQPLRSLTHYEGLGRVGLYRFDENPEAQWPADPTYFDVVIRNRNADDAGGWAIAYLRGNRLVVSDKTSGAITLLADGSVYAPTQITVGGQTITILAKQ